MAATKPIREAIDAHQQRFKTLLLSTLRTTGDGSGSPVDLLPELSYAPYSLDPQGRFYIFISDLAGHSQNLRQHPECSLMLIADERDSRNLFARERLSYRCQAELVTQSDPQFESQLKLLQQRSGEVVKLLRNLPDFKLYRLTPVSGRYVVGFGRAYDIDPATGGVSAVEGG